MDLIEELELQLDQEFLAFCKQDSPTFRQSLPIASAPGKISSKISLAPVKSSENLGKDTTVAKSAIVNVTNSKPKSPTLNRGKFSKTSSPRKTLIKGGKIHSGSVKNDALSGKSNLISKIMDLRRESTTAPGGSKSGEKSAKIKKTEEKVICMSYELDKGWIEIEILIGRNLELLKFQIYEKSITKI